MDIFFFWFTIVGAWKKDAAERQVTDQVKWRHLTFLLPQVFLATFPGRKSSPVQGVTTKPRCHFDPPMKYFGRYMEFKRHLDLTQHGGNSASHRLKPLLDVSLHGPEALPSKMKTCNCLTKFSYWTTHHGSSLRLCNIISIKRHFFQAAYAVTRSYNFLWVCQRDTF